MLKYLNSDPKLVLTLNMGAFVLLAEAWATYLPDFYYRWLSQLYHLWTPDFYLDSYLDYNWISLGEVIGLVAFHSLIWIIPYRVLTFLRPIKTIPYLYILSVGTVTLLFIEQNGFKPLDLDTQLFWNINNMLIYILPAFIFHGYFSARQKSIANSALASTALKKRNY